MKQKVNDYIILQGFREGKTQEELAEKTGASIYTVQHHLVKLCELETIRPEHIVSSDDLDAILSIVPKTGWNGRLQHIYDTLQGRYDMQTLKMLTHSPSFLKILEERMKEEGTDPSNASSRYRLYKEKAKTEYLQIPGIYVYFIFAPSENENPGQLLFIDVAANLGKIIRDCKETAGRVGYIEVDSIEEGKVLAGYYTAGMSPAYPTSDPDKNVIISIDEKKRKPGMILLLDAGEN